MGYDIKFKKRAFEYKNEGSEIELHLVKCLVELHVGKVWVNSEEVQLGITGLYLYNL